MKNADTTWKNSIFGRLILMFLLIMIPLYLIGIGIYKWGIDTVREEISNSSKTQVSFYLNSFEEEIKRIQALQYECLQDENLNMLATVSNSMEEYEWSRAVLRLQQRLLAIKNSSNYISRVTAYIPTSDLSISDRDVETGIDQIFSLTRKATVASEARINYWENKLVLISRYPVTYTNNRASPIYAIEIELSPQELQKALDQLETYEDSGLFLMDMCRNFTITDSVSRETASYIQSHVLQDIDKARQGVQSIVIDKKPYMLIYARSEYLSMMLFKYVPENKIFERLKKFQFWFWVFTLIALVIIIFFSTSTYRFIHKPLAKLVKSFKKVENGDLDIAIGHDHYDEFRYLYRRFNAMVENLNTLIDQNYKQKILTQRAELKHLQSQINPHFLYNSFFILYNMVRAKDYENLEYFTKQLGNYFQFITRSASDEVPLFREVSHARVYAEIQARRFRNRIRLEFGQLPLVLNDTLVPRLILQPVIENSFEHGLENKVRDGLIRVEFLHDEKSGRILISVEDNGGELDDEKIAALRGELSDCSNHIESTGIINIHERLRFKFGPESGLNVSRGNLGGLRVEIFISNDEGEKHV